MFHLLDTFYQITGEASEQQILSALRAYPDRASYMTEALRGLFHFSKNWTEEKPEVLQVKLPANSNSLNHGVLINDD